MKGSADVVVIGSGFGGLGAALSLAERGVKVTLVEALDYPGGCASTFTRKGLRFESGATLFSGFGKGQLFRTWIDRHGMDIELDWLDPIVKMRAPGLHLDIPQDRASLIQALEAHEGVPSKKLRAFFAMQKGVADTLWSLFDDPALLPPLGLSALWAHLRALPRYLSLLRLVGRSLEDILRRYDLHTCAPLVTFLDALCQITVQASVKEAEAPFALATMDYYFRGTVHVRGGIGELAWAMVRAIEALGGEVHFLNKAKALRREGEAWILTTRQGELKAKKVVANLLPQDLRRLLGQNPGDNKTLDRLSEAVETGWGAAMLYLTLRPPAGASPAPLHLELVADPSKPFMEGNHIFLSLSGLADEGRAPAGLRTATISTHIPLPRLRAMSKERRGAYIARVQETMRRTLQALAPQWYEGIESELTASPRTFRRFTQRFEGYVGGIPRRQGLSHYRQLWPLQPERGLYMVGDSVFPGQSTLATAIGGERVAAACAKALY